MKVFVVGGNTNYVNFLHNAELTDNLEEARLVVFTGGADVHPSLYGCMKHPSTCSDRARDEREKAVFDRIDPKRQVVYGCCRGSQFVTVMNGGKLIQDVRNHALSITHPITDGKKIYEITSTHHQMMYPFCLKEKEDYEILFHTPIKRSNGAYSGDQIDAEAVTVEPEIVLYHVKNKPKCLAVQGHPEMIPDSFAAKMIEELINRLTDEID